MITTGPTKPRAAGAQLGVEWISGCSSATSAGAAHPLKLLVPKSRGTSVWAYLSNHGGGFVAGDVTSLDVAVGPLARCFLGTQSSTKVYRNPDKLPCGHTLLAAIGKGGVLVSAPDSVQCFAGSVYDQRQEFHMESGSGLVSLDWFGSGRAACGEKWAFDRFSSCNEIWIDKHLVVLDSMLLTNEDGPLDSCARMSRFHCAATLVVLGEPFQTAAHSILEFFASLPVTRQPAILHAASPIRDGVIVRATGNSMESLQRLLLPRLDFLNDWLGDNPWARKW